MKVDKVTGLTELTGADRMIRMTGADKSNRVVGSQGLMG